MALHGYMIQSHRSEYYRETATPCYVAIVGLIYKCNKYQERYTERATTPNPRTNKYQSISKNFSEVKYEYERTGQRDKERTTTKG